MKFASEELKNKFKQHGSLIIAAGLFIATFLITMFVMKACNYVEIDRFEVGRTVREIVDGEDGEVVATINGTSYYEKDLLLVAEMLKLSEPTYTKLNENQVRLLAGDALVQQKLLLHEFDRLSLEITDEEFNNFFEQEKQEAFEIVSLNNDDSKSLLDYISGYGCTYTEYWEDEYVIQSYKDNLKFDTVKKHICTELGYTKVSAIAIERYLTGLIEDGTYNITLFGEEFK